MVKARVNATVRCAFCKGTGIDPFRLLSRLSACPVCRSRREVIVTEPHVSCAHCRGSGVQPHTRMPCSSCGGRGVQTVREPLTICPHCGGRGNEPRSELHLSCSTCGGAGTVRDRTLADRNGALPTPTPVAVVATTAPVPAVS